MDRLYGGSGNNSNRGSKGRGFGGRNTAADSGVSANFDNDDRVAVKIRGLPYQVRYEEISSFFGDFRYIEKSVVLGLNAEGRKNGFGAILFETEDEAKAASEQMNGKHVGSRYVDLSIITYGDYRRFNGPNSGAGGGGGGDRGGKYVKLSQYVGPDNQDRSLVMRGLPYRVVYETIQQFFDGYGSLAEDDIYIEEFNGKRTGSALVVFENENVAQDAKQALHRKEIDGRYVELFDQNDPFMIKICQLG